MPIFDFNSTVTHFYVDLIKMQFLLKQQISTINNFLRFRKLFLWRHDIQHSDIQHNNTQHNDIQCNSIICDPQHNDPQHKHKLSLC